MFILTLFDLLSSFPGLLASDSGWVVAAIIAFAPLSLVTLVLIAHPTSRRVNHRG